MPDGGFDSGVLRIAEHGARLFHLHDGAAKFLEVEHLRGRQAERIGQHADVEQRQVALATLDAAQVGAGQAAFQRERFLRPAALLAQPRKVQSELSESLFGHDGRNIVARPEARSLTLQQRHLIFGLTIGV
ncbi:hypothetical protein AWV79_19895 [Cupriavidus sp. UYMMa02A]|nr:hypothetical protein AWV79_19895 [Cupriavidus sp. UYMMa02A]